MQDLNETKLKRLTTKSAFRVVELELLKVDESYQREVKRGYKKIVAEFNEEALGIPIIGEREDRTLWIVDGQQRITALKQMGRKNVRCEVFRSDGPEHEAKIFKLINLNRTKLKPIEEFKALLTSGDEVAWAIKECVEKCGFSVVVSKSGNRPQSSWKQLTCVNTLLNLYKNREGTESIEFCLKVIDTCWPEDKMATNARIFSGMNVWWSRRKGIIDMERLLPRFQKTTPHKILYTAHNATAGENNSSAVADVLERIYVKRKY